MSDAATTRSGQESPISRLVRTRAGWGRRVLSPWMRGFLDHGAQSRASGRRRSQFATGTRMLLAHVRSIPARSRVWKPNIGPLGPAFVGRFSHLLLSRYRGAVRPIARRQMVSSMHAWGEDLDLILSGRVPDLFGQTGELQAGMRIAPRAATQAPGTFTAGQRIEPLSSPSSSSVQSLFEARAASVRAANSEPRARRPGPRAQERRQLAPDVRLFSRVEEVKPGGVARTTVQRPESPQQELPGEEEQLGAVEPVETMPESVLPHLPDHVDQVSPGATNSEGSTRQTRTQAESPQSESTTRRRSNIIQRSPRMATSVRPSSAPLPATGVPDSSTQIGSVQEAVSRQRRSEVRVEDEEERVEDTPLPATPHAATDFTTRPGDEQSTAPPPAMKAPEVVGAQSPRRPARPASHEIDSPSGPSGGMGSTISPRPVERSLEEQAGEAAVSVEGPEPVQSARPEQARVEPQTVEPPTQAREQVTRVAETGSSRVPAAPVTPVKPAIQRQPKRTPLPAPGPRKVESFRPTPGLVRSRSDRQPNAERPPTHSSLTSRQEDVLPAESQQARQRDVVLPEQESELDATSRGLSLGPVHAKTGLATHGEVESSPGRGPDLQGVLPVRPSRQSRAERVPVGVSPAGPGMLGPDPVAAGDQRPQGISVAVGDQRPQGMPAAAGDQRPQGMPAVEPVLVEQPSAPLAGMVRRIQRRYRHPVESVRGLPVQRASLVSYRDSRVRRASKALGTVAQSVSVLVTRQRAGVSVSRLTAGRRGGLGDGLNVPRARGGLERSPRPEGASTPFPLLVPAEFLQGDERALAQSLAGVFRTGRRGEAASSSGAAMPLSADQVQDIPALLAALEGETARSHDFPLLPRVVPETRTGTEQTKTSPADGAQIAPVRHVSSIPGSVLQRYPDATDMVETSVNQIDMNEEMSTDDLSQLARLVYPFVKRLLALERERWPRR